MQAAVRRHVRNSAFAKAEKVISFVLSDPQVQQARARIEAAETQLGMELCARLQPFQDRYEQAVREGDAARLTRICPGKHGTAAGDVSASWTTATRPRWRNRTGATTARGSRSRGRAARPTTGECTRSCRHPRTGVHGGVRPAGRTPGALGGPGSFAVRGSGIAPQGLHAPQCDAVGTGAAASHWSACRPWDPGLLPLRAM